MCIICVEVEMERMTLQEAGHACTEIIATSSDEKQKEHTKKLKKAIDNCDIVEIVNIINEGNQDESNKSGQTRSHNP